MGGKIEAFYWATGGEHNGVGVVELPDAATLTAFSTIAQATGAFDVAATTELISSSELDQALAKTITYRPPGG
jgi:uncharacterized protein with GYD domain